MHQVVASGLTRTRQALLGYVARYGVTDEATCRQVAARIWRSVPRHLDAAQVIAAADGLLGNWASERLGHTISAAQLRLAILETGIDARILLAPQGPTPEAATRLLASIPLPTPPETPVDMPVQALFG